MQSPTAPPKHENAILSRDRKGAVKAAVEQEQQYEYEQEQEAAYTRIDSYERRLM